MLAVCIHHHLVHVKPRTVRARYRFTLVLSSNFGPSQPARPAPVGSCRRLKVWQLVRFGCHFIVFLCHSTDGAAGRGASRSAAAQGRGPRSRNDGARSNHWQGPGQGSVKGQLGLLGCECLAGNWTGLRTHPASGSVASMDGDGMIRGHTCWTRQQSAAQLAHPPVNT